MGRWSPIGYRQEGLPSLTMADKSTHAARSPGERIWHLIPTPLASFAICGEALRYGARLRAWTEVPEEDRCDLCVQRY